MSDQPTATETPDLYDVEAALNDLAHYRVLPNELLQAEAVIADKLAIRLAEHFPDPELREAAGIALVLMAASIGVLCNDPDLPNSTLPNIVGFAGSRLVVDVRNAKGVNHG